MKLLRSLVYISFILSLFACEQKLTPLESLIRDKVATRLLKKEKTEEALDQYLKILETSPNEPAVHSNIGVIFNQTQKPDEALKSFQLSLKLAEDQKDLAGQFAARYNLGTFYGAQKKIAEALENYQAALEIVPTSKETKTNIELLIQQQQQQQKQKSGGQGESKESSDNDQQDKDQKQQGEGKDQENKDQKQDQDDKDKESEKDGKKEKPKDYQGSSKYQPRPFQGEQLSEGDVKKILGELRNQEQKIRANFEKKERKESKNEKDW